MEGVPLLVLIVGIAFCIFWVVQFVQVMLLSDADFPGKYDKGLWTAVFIHSCLFRRPICIPGVEECISSDGRCAARTKEPDVNYP
jgi:hypothetical protein